MVNVVPPASPPAGLVRICTPLIDAAEDAGLITFLAALEAAGLLETVTGEDAGLTVFAPTDLAFEEALASLGLTLEDLVGDMELLSEILLYHILPSDLAVMDLTAGENFTTLLGNDSSCGIADVSVAVGEEVTIVGGQSSASIEIPDVDTCSGIMHIINFVLVPCLGPVGPLAMSPSPMLMEPALAPLESPVPTSEGPVPSPAMGPLPSPGPAPAPIDQIPLSPSVELALPPMEGRLPGAEGPPSTMKPSAPSSEEPLTSPSEDDGILSKQSSVSALLVIFMNECLRAIL